MVALLGERKAGAREQAGDVAQARDERLQIGNDETDAAAHHLRLTRRQVELRLADVDPHVVDPGHEIGIAGETETAHVENGGELLVRDGDVDVLELDDVADVLGGAVEGGAASHGANPRRCPHDVASPRGTLGERRRNCKRRGAAFRPPEDYSIAGAASTTTTMSRANTATAVVPSGASLRA